MENRKFKQGLYVFNVLATAFCALVDFYLFTITFEFLYIAAVLIFVLACRKNVKVFLHICKTPAYSELYDNGKDKGNYVKYGQTKE